MFIRRDFVALLVRLVVVLSGTVACTAQVNAKWVERLASTYYDSRSEFDKWNARAADSEGCATIIETWNTALQGKTTHEVSAIDLLTFAGRYDPLWSNDRFQRSESDKRIARIRLLDSNNIARWHSALETTQQSSVSELWTIAFMVDIERLFTNGAFDSKTSDLMLARLRTVPTDAVRTLADTLNAGNAKAAVLIIQNDTLFDSNGFRQASFDQAVTKLREATRSRKH